MTETLTQKEVDALLKGSAPAPPLAAATQVAPYNFVRPPRVTKERRATLEAIYARFALALQALLSSRLRTPTDVVVSSVEQAMFSEFLLSLGSPCAAFVFKVGDHLGGEGVIDLGTDFAFHLVDRLFGGPGDPLPLHRALTSIERTVVQGVAERSLTVLRDAWQDQLPMAPEVTGFESSPDMLQITSRVDNVLVANLEVHSGSFRGFLTICLPMGSLEPFLQEKAAARQPAGRGDSDQAAARASLEASLLQAQLTLSARFPQFRLTAREVAGLQVGQVVQTGQPLDTLVEMHVNGRLRYLGALGQRRRRVGLRIVQPAAPAAGRTGCATEGRVS